MGNEAGMCPRCGARPRVGSEVMGAGMFLEFSCRRCKLRAVWTYSGPPGVSIWFEAGCTAAVNDYLKQIYQWREKAFMQNTTELGGFTWDMTAPPAPTKDLFLVCVDMNHQHVALKPRTEEG